MNKEKKLQRDRDQKNWTTRGYARPGACEIRSSFPSAARYQPSQQLQITAVPVPRPQWLPPFPNMSARRGALVPVGPLGSGASETALPARARLRLQGNKRGLRRGSRNNSAATHNCSSTVESFPAQIWDPPSPCLPCACADLTSNHCLCVGTWHGEFGRAGGRAVLRCRPPGGH